MDLAVGAQNGRVDAGVLEEVVGGLHGSSSESVGHMSEPFAAALFRFAQLVERGMFCTDGENWVVMVCEEEAVYLETNLDGDAEK